MNRTKNRSIRVAAAIGLLGAASCGGSEPLPETPPRQISGSTFQYPEELWDENIEGQTILRIFVTEAGTVDSVAVETSSGHAAFDSAAVHGAHRLQFEPARRGEEPVGIWVLLPVDFDMSTAPASESSDP
jgi:TonB family protein